MRFAVVAAMLAAALPLCAQIDNGNITGRVTDPSGAVVAGARVTLTQTETNFESAAVTNGEGIFRALDLRPGPYRITFTATGFKKLVREGVELRVNSTLTVDAKLEVGEVNESVEVMARSQLLDTETSASGTTMPGTFFYDLPNYQRHASAVLFFTPGATFASNADTKGLGSFSSLDGIGSGQIGYFEDGVLATMEGRNTDNSETVDNSIEDMKIFTSAMPAEFGHTAGVGVSIVKKSGSNEIHGALSEQFRTRSMQERKFFDEYRLSQVQPGYSIKPPPLIVQNPDAFLSGPVYIPKIYDGRNKTFFFYGMQMLIEKQGKQLTATVPTPAMLAGNFQFAGSGVTPNVIYDPESTSGTVGSTTNWSRSPFPNNIIPASRISKVAKAFLAFNPIAAPDVAGNWTTTGPTNNFEGGPMKITIYQDETGRLDHQFTSSLKAYASYTFNHEWGYQPPIAITNNLFNSNLNKGITDRHTASVGLTWVASPTLVNDIRLNYYQHNSNNSSITYNKDYASLLGLGADGLPKTCLPGVIPALITDQASLSPGCPSVTIQENYTLKDDLSKSWRAHNFKMGYEFLRYHQNSRVGPGNVDGSFTYAGVGGLQPNGTSIANTGGITTAQFLTGDISGFSFSENLDNQYTRSYMNSVYFQDDWKVSSNLTVNFGVRYDVEPPKTYKGGYISIFSLTVPDDSIVSNQAYTAFCPSGGCMGAWTHPRGAKPFDTDWGRVDPEAGLAWRFAPKMVLRAGARISHTDTFTDATSLLFLNQLLSNSYSASQVSGNFNPLFNLNNPIPAWSYPALRPDGSTPIVSTNAPDASPTIVPPHLKTPYVATWNIGIQRELSKDYKLEVRWEGSALSKGFGSININTRAWGMIPDPNHDGGMMNLNDPANALYRYQWATNSITSYQTQYARPYPNLGDVQIECNCTHNDHNAGIVSLQKRLSRGLNFQVFYTFSKSLSPSSTTDLNPYLNWGLYKSRSGTDQTHNFTGAMTYEAPFGKGRRWMNHSNRILDSILGGYNIYWTYTIASGLPAGMSITGQSLGTYTAGTSTFTNINVPQYPSFMPNFGGVVLLRRPSMREDWQDLGGDRFNEGNQNSMINCGPVVLAPNPNAGNSCFTMVQPFSLGNNGANVWNNQRIIAASAAIGKTIPIKDRLNLQLRLDFQNPLKWYNWGGPNTALNVQSAANALLYGKINPGSNGETSTGTQGYGGTPLLNMTVALKW